MNWRTAQEPGLRAQSSRPATPRHPVPWTLSPEPSLALDPAPAANQHLEASV